jgi:hypothetical protein
MTHFGAEAQQRSADRHSGSSCRGFSELIRDLAVVESELYPRNDEVTIQGTKPFQGGFIASKCLAANDVLERRGIGGGFFR